MDIEELALFDEPPRIADTPVSLAQTQRDLRPVWSDYHGKHQPCDACVRECHAGTRRSMPAPARLVRSVKATGERVLLCTVHAQPLRAADQAASQKTRGRRR